MGQLIHEDETRMADQGGVQIKLLDVHLAIAESFSREQRKLVRQGFGVLAAVRFDVAQEHVHAFLFLFYGGFKHGVGFSHTSGHAEEDFEPTTLLLCLPFLDRGQQSIWIWAVFFGHRLTLAGPSPSSLPKR